METIDVAVKYVTSTITTNKNTNTLNTVIDLGDRILQTVEILFAPGHVALTGVRLLMGGTAILPWNQPTSFIFGDNERLTFKLGIYVPGPITIVTHNADSVAHMHQITFALTEVPDKSSGLYTPVPLVVI